MEINSPITSRPQVVKEKELDIQAITKEYKKQLNIDVKGYFARQGHLSLYKCLDTGYRFFYPPIEGDSSFYEQLQTFPWYYMEWKWEHQRALELIGKNDKVLEVGSGRGSFVRKLVASGRTAEGLELNKKSVEKGQARGLKIYNIDLDKFATQCPSKYDVVCFFQVLEHVYDVNSFLDNSISLLKTGGKLIISVPNDSSFLGEDDGNILNLPPHHVGLWSEDALHKISGYFPVELINLYLEPLQRYHFLYYYQVKIGRRIEDKLGVSGWILNKFLSRLFYLYLFLFAGQRKGHTILAEFKKI